MASKEWRVYTPGENNKKFITRIADAIGDVKNSWFLVKALFVRDLKGKYRQTSLGFFGAIWPAVMSTLVFVFLNATNLLNVDTGKVPYVIYAFTGSVFWTFFIDCFSIPALEFLRNTSMLTRLDFPREALVIKGMVDALFNLAIKMAFWVFLLIYFKVNITHTILVLPLFILNLAVISFAGGLITLPVIVIYRDLQQMLSTGLSLLMYVTPVMYPVSQMKYFSDYSYLNPLAQLFAFMRNCIFNDNMDLLGYNVVFFAISVFLLLVGWAIYRISISFLIERMQA